jgi:hypothetical protein
MAGFRTPGAYFFTGPLCFDALGGEYYSWGSLLRAKIEVVYSRRNSDLGQPREWLPTRSIKDGPLGDHGAYTDLRSPEHLV